MLRCTAKVLALLRVSEPAIGEACEQDWYVHLIRIDRRKCLLVTHAGTLFSVFMPNVTAARLRPIGPPVVSAIQAALQAEHLPIQRAMLPTPRNPRRECGSLLQSDRRAD